jgi:hypothetical protein
VTIGSLPWAITYANGGVVSASLSTWEDFPEPKYPFERTIEAGTCVRGWVVFPALKDQRPVAVEYSPEGRVAIGWAVS